MSMIGKSSVPTGIPTLGPPVRGSRAQWVATEDASTASYAKNVLSTFAPTPSSARVTAKPSQRTHDSDKLTRANYTDKTISCWLTTIKPNTVIMSLGLNPALAQSQRKLKSKRKLDVLNQPYIGVFQLSVGVSGGIYYAEQGTTASGESETWFLSDYETPIITTGYRTHIALTTNRKSFSLYINGVRVIQKTLSLPQPIIIPNRYACIGGDCITLTNYFDGEIDSIRIYNRSLSLNDIQNLFHRTVEPTPEPTPIPTSMPTYEPICLKLLLVDSFGDGWESARLVAFGSRGSHRSYMLQCGHNRLFEEYCFTPESNNDGDYVVVSVLGFRVDRYWEILYQVFNEFDGQLYTGDFDTSMTFSYHKDKHEWTGLYSSSIKIQSTKNLLPNSFECESCGKVEEQENSEGQKVGVWQRTRLQDIDMSKQQDDGTSTSGGKTDENGNTAMTSGMNIDHIATTEDILDHKDLPGVGDDIDSTDNNDTNPEEDNPDSIVSKEEKEEIKKAEEIALKSGKKGIISSSTSIHNEIKNKDEKIKDENDKKSSNDKKKDTPEKKPAATKSSSTSSLSSSSSMKKKPPAPATKSESLPFSNHEHVGGVGGSSIDSKPPKKDTKPPSIPIPSTPASSHISSGSSIGKAPPGGSSSSSVHTVARPVTVSKEVFEEEEDQYEDVEEEEYTEDEDTSTEAEETDPEEEEEEEEEEEKDSTSFTSLSSAPAAVVTRGKVSSTSSSSTDNAETTDQSSSSTSSMQSSQNNPIYNKFVSSKRNSNPNSNTNGEERSSASSLFSPTTRGNENSNANTITNTEEEKEEEERSSFVSHNSDNDNAAHWSKHSNSQPEDVSAARSYVDKNIQVAANVPSHTTTTTTTTGSHSSQMNGVKSQNSQMNVEKPSSKSQLGSEAQSSSHNTVSSETHNSFIPPQIQNNAPGSSYISSKQSSVLQSVAKSDGNVNNNQGAIRDSIINMNTAGMPVFEKRNLHNQNQNLQYKLESSNNLVWFSDDGFGAGFEIFQNDNNLHYLGTRCGYNDQHCDIGLEDGNYYWRVSGSLLPVSYRKGIAWEFCNVKGAASTEMAIQITDGVCYPLQSRNLSEICTHGDFEFSTSSSSSVMTLSGVIHLGGLTSEDVNEDHLTIIQAAITREFRDAIPLSEFPEDSVQVTPMNTFPGVNLNPSTSSIGDRKGLAQKTSTSTSIALKFVATISTKDFRAHREENHHKFVADLKTYLQRSMSTGVFITRVISQAHLSDVKNLQHISKAELIELSILHVSNRPHMMSSISDLIVIVAAVSGVLVGVLMAIPLFREHSSSFHLSLMNLNFRDKSAATSRKVDLYPLSEGMYHHKIHDLLTQKHLVDDDLEMISL
eukprot:gene5601-11293_t